MFEMRPYAKRNNSLYNPFRDMDEFEKKFFSSPFGFFDTNMLDEFKKAEGIDLSGDKMAMQRLKEAAEKAKKELSSKGHSP